MIVHSENNKEGEIRFRFERENAWEWVRFPVSWDYHGKGMPVPRFYSHVFSDYNRQIRWYFFTPLAPFVRVWMWTTRRWIMLSKHCYHRGWYPHEEGTVVPLTWPIVMIKHVIYKNYATITKGGQAQNQK